MDKILEGVTPVNTPKPKPTRKKRTKKQDADARHQSPSTARHKDILARETFSLGMVNREVVEQQLLLGRGEWHPSNKDSIPLDELRKNAELLIKDLGTAPAMPTPLMMLGEEPISPYTKYQPQVGMENEKPNPDIVNNLQFSDAEGDFNIEMYMLAPAIIRKCVSRDKVHLDRAIAFRSYFNYMAEVMLKLCDEGARYNGKVKQYRKKKALSDKATSLFKEQLSYENSLTEMDRKTIDQDSTIRVLQEQIAALQPKEETA